MDLIKKQIEEILSIPQEYIMYRGGAGGEFLLGQIYKYSKKYKNNIQNLSSSNNNTFFVDETHIHAIINANGPKVTYTSTFNELLDIIAESAINLTEDEIQYSIDTINLLKDSNPNILMRTHESTNSYFFNKTFLFYPDMILWCKYWYLLAQCKVGYNTTSIIKLNIEGSSLGVERIQGLDAFNTDTIIEYCNENNIEKINKLKFEYALLNNLSKKEIHNLFGTPLAKIPYREYSNSVCINDRFFKSINLDHYNIIKYVKYFSKGYLEDKFEIDSNEFHDNLIQWHENNLTLLSKNGFDIEPYKL